MSYSNTYCWGIFLEIAPEPEPHKQEQSICYCDSFNNTWLALEESPSLLFQLSNPTQALLVLVSLIDVIFTKKKIILHQGLTNQIWDISVANKEFHDPNFSI